MLRTACSLTKLVYQQLGIQMITVACSRCILVLCILCARMPCLAVNTKTAPRSLSAWAFLRIWSHINGFLPMRASSSMAGQ